MRAGMKAKASTNHSLSVAGSTPHNSTCTAKNSVSSQTTTRGALKIGC
jgi:hypothetical protein